MRRGGGTVSANQANLNRCLFCGFDATIAGGMDSDFCGACSDLTCRAEGPTCNTEEAAAKAWNESYVAKALETLGHRCREGCHVRYFIKGEWRLMHGSQAIASGETMLDMILNLHDKVTK